MYAIRKIPSMSKIKSFFKKYKDIITYVAVGSIFVTVISLLIYAITHTPDDKLLEACWSPSGQAEYVDEFNADEAHCSDPEEIRWSSDRLLVAVIENDTEIVPVADIPGSLDYAVDIVNFQLGTNLSFTDDVRNADIVVDWHAAFIIDGDGGETPLGDSAGYCVHRKVGDRLIASMVVRPAGENALEGRVAVHEFGHCLGLAHGDFGIMRRVTTTTDPFVMFSDSQIDIIQELYPD